MVIIYYLGHYEVPLGESGIIHIGRKVVKTAMPHKRQWVDGTNANVGDVQEVFFTSKRSVTVEMLSEGLV